MFKPRVVGPLCTAALFAIGVIAVAQDKKPTAETKPAAGQPTPEEIAKFMQLSLPSEGHAKLKPLAGKWNFVTKYRMGPDAPWSESTGKAEFKWMMGDRFLVQDIKGNPDPGMGGLAFEGHGMMGYDNITKKYWSNWVDNMGTGVMISEGTADGSGKTFTFDSEYSCPMVGGEKSTKTVMRIEGDDKAVFEMYDKDPTGKEFKGLEVTYTRVK